MPTPSTIETAHTIPATQSRTNACRASILVLLVGSESPSAVFAEYRTNCTSSDDSAPATDTPEPDLLGLYRDRDGDIWQKTDDGWRLRRQHGVAVDDASLWEWMGGHVRDYGPFVPLTAE
ncbi:hypothetical protein ABZ942_01740 [Nocardia sp. NPDC046473]|uniref:hypothetical protein n=1 Tax=Nocardia sp. NPDC046473 TaxID=3155733 RepID=UPI0033D99880